MNRRQPTIGAALRVASELHIHLVMKRWMTAVLGIGFSTLLAGCGPSPEAVCQKTFDLVKADVGEPAAKKAIGGDMATCVKHEEQRKEIQGMMKYKKNNECLMAATTAKAASACTK